jgi:hypothetical protein
MPFVNNQTLRRLRNVYNQTELAKLLGLHNSNSVYWLRVTGKIPQPAEKQGRCSVWTAEQVEQIKATLNR